MYKEKTVGHITAHLQFKPLEGTSLLKKHYVHVCMYVSELDPNKSSFMDPTDKFDRFFLIFFYTLYYPFGETWAALPG